MGTLRQINRELLVAARQAEERPFRRYLPNGLKVEVTQFASGDVQLLLERQDVDPAGAEWATMLKHWPELVPPGVTPARRTEGRAHRLIGRWPRPAEISETA